VTVSCAEGETGVVMDGVLPFDTHELRLADLPATRTRIFINVADPERAFALSFLPVDGVGLVRQEFIIADGIGIHPMALLHPERTDEATRQEIARRAGGAPSPAAFYVDRLAQGIARIAAAFHPRPVVVRLSDFKSNEYAGLVGGAFFEPREENPMLGLRGASRYVHPSFREAFALECAAIRRVRGDLGLGNVIVMVPFCRTLGEAAAVSDELARHGLRRGADGLRLYVMCEIPSNVLLIDRFAQYFDGFSIGSNDLTQLVLGIDRDSALLGDLFDERDPAVQASLLAAVAGAHAAQRPIGICGQAPSDHPSIAELLVRAGIDSVSLSPDAAVRTRLQIAELERSLKTAPPASGMT
jgi:pyruvate,water dikinase